MPSSNPIPPSRKRKGGDSTSSDAMPLTVKGKVHSFVGTLVLKMHVQPVTYDHMQRVVGVKRLSRAQTRLRMLILRALCLLRNHGKMGPLQQHLSVREREKSLTSTANTPKLRLGAYSESHLDNTKLIFAIQGGGCPVGFGEHATVFNCERSRVPVLDEDRPAGFIHSLSNYRLARCQECLCKMSCSHRKDAAGNLSIEFSKYPLMCILTGI